MNNPNRYYTRGAQEGADFAEGFKREMAGVEVAPGRYRAEITMPNGPSTAGGVLVLQRLRLVPQSKGYPVLVIGTVNMQEAKVLLRSVEHLEAIYRLRFKKPLELNRVQYKDLLAKMLAFFEADYMKATMEPMPAKVVLDEDVAVAVTIPKGLVAALVLVAGALVWWLAAR